jgi:hypothetical protein
MRVFFGKAMQGLTKESKRCILNKRLRKRFYALVKDFCMASLQKSLEEVDFEKQLVNQSTRKV